MNKNQLIEIIEDRLGIDYLGFIEEIGEPEKFIGNKYLPAKNEHDYDWVYHIFDNTVAMAKMMARGDAETPIVGGPAVKKVAGSVAPFGQKFEVNKSILNKIFNPRNDNELKSNLRRILDQSARNVRSAQARREWLRFQVLAKGSITLQDRNENNVISVDFGLPGNHKIDSSALEGDAWDGSSPKPLSDLINACDIYYETNDEMPGEILLRKAQAKQITGSAEVAGEFSENATRISLGEVNDYLAELGYPPIKVHDVKVNTEGPNGRPTNSEYLIPDNRVVLVKKAGGQEIKDTGRLVMGPVSENNFKPGIFTTMYEELDPMRYWHFMKAEMWPAVYNPEYILFMDVQA
ncbi:MAG TPA: major capsid protein [Halanaerobiales bacterium]|nr:major capsid protein [Halanaerobiales bacterium]